MFHDGENTRTGREKSSHSSLLYISGIAFLFWKVENNLTYSLPPSPSIQSYSIDARLAPFGVTPPPPPPRKKARITGPANPPPAPLPRLRVPAVKYFGHVNESDAC